MEHLHHKHAGPMDKKSIAQKAAVESDFVRYEEIIRDLQIGVDEVIKE